MAAAKSASTATTYTNYAAGPRGINLANGATKWLDPGQSVDLEDDELGKGELPDLGKKSDVATANLEQAADLAAARAQIEALTAENAALTAQVAEQAAQIETLTKPA